MTENGNIEIRSEEISVGFYESIAAARYLQNISIDLLIS